MAGKQDNNTLRPLTQWPIWLGYPLAVVLEVLMALMFGSFKRYLPLTEFPMPYILSNIALAYLFGFRPGIFALIFGLGLYIRLLGPVSTYSEQSWAGITAYIIGSSVGGYAALVIRNSSRRIYRLVDQLSESSSHVINILESIGDPFFALDKDWRFKYINQEAGRLLQRNPDDLTDKIIWEEFPDTVGTKLYDGYKKAVKEHTIVEIEDFYPLLSEWFEVRAYPTTDGLSVYFHDITERKTAEEILQKYRILSERTREIIFFVRKDGRILEANIAAEMAYGYSRDELLKMSIQDIRAPETRARTLEDLAEADRKGLLFETIHQRKDGSMFPVEVSISGAYIRSGRDDKVLRGPGASSVGNERVLLNIVRDITERKRAEEAIKKSRAEAEQAAERERSFSSTLQKALIPGTPEVEQGYEVAAIYDPAYTSQEIGGDFYDVFPTEKGKIGILIGDVAGKGVEAAALAAATKSTVRAFAYDIPSPGEAMTHANSVLYSQQMSVGSFVTVLLAIIDRNTGKLSYTRCGHTPAVVIRAGGSEELLGEGDPPIGLEKDRQFGESHSVLHHGDKLVVYTDGISEARRDGEMFEIPRIEAVLMENYKLPPDQLAQRLLNAALDWTGGKLTDDAAIVVLERTKETLVSIPLLTQGEGI